MSSTKLYVTGNRNLLRSFFFFHCTKPSTISSSRVPIISSRAVRSTKKFKFVFSQDYCYSHQLSYQVHCHPCYHFQKLPAHLTPQLGKKMMILMIIHKTMLERSSISPPKDKIPNCEKFLSSWPIILIKYESSAHNEPHHHNNNDTMMS
jgi:hypothetical protein